jgi:predicted nucleotidyltransferase
MTISDGLNEDFRDLLIELADAGVDFVIVGAFALAFHGAPRASGDIDIFVRPEPTNASRLVKALLRFGAPLDSAAVSEEDFARPGLVYLIGLPPRRIDILTEISGVSFDEAWASRESAEVDGRPVHIIGRETFLKNKAASGRPKDLADVARLEHPGKPRAT